MYKLVAVAGKLRGKEYPLEEGENILGRDSGCDIPLTVQGVSKRHMSITVTGDTCYLKDLGSSNGTFLNGKVITRATVKNGDKIALPDTILQVVFVEEKKNIIKKKKTDDDEDEEEDYITGGTPPQVLPQKIVWMFKYKLMPFLHGINQEYEYAQLLGILLFLFCVSAVSLTIFPVLESSKRILLVETVKRGVHYADQVARINRVAISQKKLDKVDTNFIAREEGVLDYRLFDMEGRILRPMDKLNDYVQDPFYVEAMNWGEATKNKPRNILGKSLDDGKIGIARKVVAFNPNIGQEEAIAIIAIRFAPETLKVEAAKSRTAFLESLVTTFIVAILFYGFSYFLMLRPLEEMKVQIEDALRGKRKSLETEYLMKELNPLRGSINTMLARIRELNNEEEDEFAEEESDETYVASLHEFMMGAQGPVMVLDSEKNLSHINLEAEDLTGIRENSSQGMSLLDVSREQGFAATVIELCDNSANNNGTNQSSEYELAGIPQNVHVTSLMGKDGFAKAYYVTFVKEE